MMEVRAAAAASCPSPACRTNRTRVWPDVTRSPSPTSTSVTRSPGASRVTTASSRATRNPVTRMVEEKHAFVARTTLTCTVLGELVSAAKSVADGLASRMIPPTRVALASPESFMDDAWMSGPCRLSTASLQLTNDTKSIRRISYVGIIPEAGRRTQIFCGTVERAAAQHAKAALTGEPRRAVLGSAAIIIVPAILHPLRRIARGVKKTEPICME